MLINVLDDYAGDLQSAIDAAVDGDRLYLPSQLDTPYLAPAGGFQINKRLEIFGDGIGKHDESAYSATDSTGTTIKAYAFSGTVDDFVFVIADSLSFVHIHDLKIIGRGLHDAPGSKAAILCDASGGICDALRFERVMVFNHTGDGFHLSGGSTSINGITLTDCSAVFCDGSGFLVEIATDVNVFGCTALGNGLKGMWFNAVECPRIIGAWVEGNEQYATAPYNDANNDSQLRIENSTGVLVQGCHFENFYGIRRAHTPPLAHSALRTAVSISTTSGGLIGGNEFVNTVEETDTRGIFLYGGSQAIEVSSNDFYSVVTMVALTPITGDPAKRCTVMPQYPRSGSGAILLPDVDGNQNFALLPDGSASGGAGAGIWLNGAYVFNDKGVGQLAPAMARPGSRAQWLQGGVGWNGSVLILPGASSTPQQWGLTLSTTGTVTHPALASTNLSVSSRHTLITSPSTANQVGELHTLQTLAWRGNAAALGGFYLCARAAIGVQAVDPANKAFWGLYYLTTAISLTSTGKPSDLINILGIGADPSDGQFQFMCNDGSGTAAKTPLGSDFPTGGSVPIMMQLELFCPPNGSVINYRVTKLNDTSVAPVVGSVNSNIPANTTFLAYHCYANTGNGDGVQAVTIKHYRAYLESDV